MSISIDLTRQYIKNYNDDKGILMMKNATALMNELNKRIKNNILKKTTVLRYMTDIRKHIKKNTKNIDLINTLLNIFRLSESDIVEIKLKYHKTMKEKLDLPKTIPINDIMKIYYKLYNTPLNKLDYLDILILLLLASGRRQIELTRRGKFYKIKKNKKCVLFTGQVKTKDDKMKYKIPILMNIKKFLKYHRNLLKMRDYSNLSNKETTGKVSKPLSRRLSKYFGNDKITSHDLRKIYVNLSYKKMFKHKKIKPNIISFANEVLGHDKAELGRGSTLNYMTLNLST